MADRWSKLAVAAYCNGTLDFSPSARDQRFREDWVIREIEEREYARLCELVHNWHMAGAWGDPENFEYHFDRVRKLYAEIGRSSMPWLDDWSKMAVNTLQAVWERFVAVGKDPDKLKQIKKMQNWLDEQVRKDTQDAQLEADIFAMLRKRARR